MRNSLSVKQLNVYIRNVFEDELVLQNIAVSGEVCDVSFSKYTYVTLKEDDCILQCVCFHHITPPQIGQKVMLSGSVQYSERLSKVSFVFKNLSVVGDGLYQAEYLKLKEKLQNKGFFEKKLPLPSFIQKVCIITSGYGSVIHDFLSGIADGHAYINVTVFHSSVQGTEAEKEICDNLKKADKKFDAVVIARGGGSANDLGCFNSEAVATAVGEMHVPVISAVGHETDYTLCDLCASYRAGTPSFAAKKITENNALLINKLIYLVRRMSKAASAKAAAKSSRLSGLTASTILAATSEISKRKEQIRIIATKAYDIIYDELYKAENKLVAATKSAERALEKTLGSDEKLLSDNAVKLDYLSPLKILGRGYSLTEKSDKPVKSVNEVEVGDKIIVTFIDGHVTADISGKEANE